MGDKVTHGSLTILAGDFFAIKAQPHVILRLKHVLPRVSKHEFGEVRLKVTNETCRDIEWFMERFPLEMSWQARVVLTGGASRHRQVQARTAAILQPGYKPKAYPLALPLRDYQGVAVSVLLENGSLLNADEVGLGKTPMAIGIFTDPRTLPALVVCPTHLCIQWQNDFLARFLPGATSHIIDKATPYELPPAEIYIISYSKLKDWGDVLSDGRLRSVVFDEAQDLRSSKSQKYAAAAAIRASAKFGLGLSATPIYNYGGEIFNIVDLLFPGRLGSRDEFHREWCTWDGKDKYLLRDPKAFGTYLRDESIMLRRTRTDVKLELPAVTRVIQNVPHDPKILDAINGEALELARLVLEGGFETSGKAALELDWKVRRATGISKAPFVAEFVKLLLEDSQKVVLFGWHREVYDIWLDRLKAFRPRLYTGTETPRKKSEAIHAFVNRDCQVLIMSLRSGSGVDGLQKVCNTAVHGELDWSPGIHDQCTGRLNRDDLLAPVMAYFPVSEGGSDPIVAQVLQLKRAQSTYLLDPQKVGGLEQMQSVGDRIKQLARAYLERAAAIKSGKSDIKLAA